MFQADGRACPARAKNERGIYQLDWLDGGPPSLFFRCALGKKTLRGFAIGFPKNHVLDSVDDLDANGDTNLTLEHLRRLAPGPRPVVRCLDLISSDSPSDDGVGIVEPGLPHTQSRREILDEPVVELRGHLEPLGLVVERFDRNGTDVRRREGARLERVVARPHRPRDEAHRQQRARPAGTLSGASRGQRDGSHISSEKEATDSMDSRTKLSSRKSVRCL